MAELDVLDKMLEDQDRFEIVAGEQDGDRRNSAGEKVESQTPKSSRQAPPSG